MFERSFCCKTFMKASGRATNWPSLRSSSTAAAWPLLVGQPNEFFIALLQLFLPCLVKVRPHGQSPGLDVWLLGVIDDSQFRILTTLAERCKYRLMTRSESANNELSVGW